MSDSSAEVPQTADRDTTPPSGLPPDHPNEQTGKELHKFDDLIAGLPLLAEQVAHLAAAMPSLREELSSLRELKQDVKDIKSLIAKAVDAGIDAAAGYQEVRYEQEQLKFRLDRSDHELKELKRQISSIPCLVGRPCGDTIPAPSSG